MPLKKFIRAFVAGMVFPAVFLPIAYTFLYASRLHHLTHNHIQFIPMYIPIVFGIANVIYVRMSEGSSPKNTNVNLWMTGIFLGILVALIGVFVLRVPTVVFGFTHSTQYMPLIVLPIVYGLIFRFVVKWLNKVIAV